MRAFERRRLKNQPKAVPIAAPNPAGKRLPNICIKKSIRL
nr:MAG TPA: hypothetical protein [Bacteriophage sp.]